MSAAGTPQFISVPADSRIVVSGPHTNAALHTGSWTANLMSLVTGPTSPLQPLSARSTVTATSTPLRRHRSRG